MKDRAEEEEVDSHRATVKGSAAGSSSPPHQPPPPGPATDIHQLPDEVLAKIFAMLSPEIIIKVLSVCRRWRGVIEDSNLIKKLALWDHSFNTEEALCLVQSAPGLKSLELPNRSDAIALLDAVSAQCTNLRHLSVRMQYEDHPRAFLNAVLKVFHTSPNLTDVGLSFYDSYDTLWFQQELGTALPNLRKIEVIGFESVEFDALVDSCHGNHMEELKASSVGDCSDETLSKLVQFWGGSLRVLELRASNFTDATLSQLVGCSELRRLKLTYLTVTWRGLHSLTALSHLEDLNMEFARDVEPESWCRFFSQSRSSHGLRNLSFLCCTDVDNRVLASIAACCPQLEQLDASYTSVTDSGVREVLRCCRKLLKLNVFDMDARLAQIVPELPQLAPQLCRIRIGPLAEHALGEATLRDVRAQMPHLRID